MTTWANNPSAPNAGIASRLTIGHHWTGVGEPGRSAIIMLASYRLFILVLATSTALAQQPRANEDVVMEQFMRDNLNAVTRIELLHQAFLEKEQRADMPYLSDFLSLYPNAHVGAESTPEGRVQLRAIASLFERYQLELRIPTHYTADNKGIKEYGLPELSLSEIRSVDGDGLKVDRRCLIPNMNEGQWRSLVDAGGDFTALNLRLEKHSPVPNFDLKLRRQAVLPSWLKTNAEPAGAGQPATRHVVKPEGGEKPQPEAERRSR